MKWISVKEKLPSVMEKVLPTNSEIVNVTVYAYNYLFGRSEWHFVSNACKCQSDAEMENVTHWMALPQLPEEK